MKGFRAWGLGFNVFSDEDKMAWMPPSFSTYSFFEALTCRDQGVEGVSRFARVVGLAVEGFCRRLLRFRGLRPKP